MELINEITINEHSSIRIGGEKVLYFDPFHVKEEVHDADVIFFTHSHYDHFSPEDFRKLAKEGTVYVAPKTCKKDLNKAKIPEKDCVFMKPDREEEVCGVKVRSVLSYNPMKPFHPKSNEWLGYVVEVGGEKVYVCGDMDDTPEGRAVDCDIVLVPCGGTYTMDAKAAAGFVNALKPKTAIPTHYGSIVGKAKDGEKFKKGVDKGIEVVFKIED